MSLSGTLFEQARAHTDRDALKIRDRRISYGELNERSLRVAAALVECGARREVVGIVGQRKASSYFGITGILYAGCSYTPINPKYSEARILEMLKDAGIRFVVGSREDLESIAPVLSRSEAGRMEAVIIPEGQAPAGSGWRGEDSLRRLTPLKSPVDAGDGDLAYVLYTSGSTGKPKGVQVLHSNVLAFLRSMSGIYPLEPGFRASQTFDLSFDPSAADMFFTWARGGVLCVLPEEDLLLPSEYIRREGITFWNAVPTIAAFMERMGALAPGSFPDLRYSMFCGEQFPQRLADAWQRAAPDSTIENLYGPTEATIYIFRHVYTRDQAGRRFRNSVIPIGRPFPGHDYALIDEAGNRLPDGAVGEIVYKGPQVTKGYLNDAGKTAASFVAFGWDPAGGTWYKSGDLGVLDGHGDLECLGRMDNQVKLAGRRIELGDIESALTRYPAIRDAVVVPLKNENQSVVGLVAFITGTLSREDESFIRQDSLTHIEKVFFPKRIVTVEALPVTGSGKVDRKALAAMAQRLFSGDKELRS